MYLIRLCMSVIEDLFFSEKSSDSSNISPLKYLLSPFLRPFVLSSALIIFWLSFKEEIILLSSHTAKKLTKKILPNLIF